MNYVENITLRVCVRVLLCFVSASSVILVRAEQSGFLCATNLVAEERIQDQELTSERERQTIIMIPETKHISLIPCIQSVMHEVTGSSGEFKDLIVGIDGPAPETLMEARRAWDHIAMYKISWTLPMRCFEHDGWFYFSGGHLNAQEYDFQYGFVMETGSTNVYRFSGSDVEKLRSIEKIEMLVYEDGKSRTKSMAAVNKAMRKCLEIKEASPTTLIEARKVIVQSSIDAEGSLNTCFEHNDAFYFIPHRDTRWLHTGGYAIRKGEAWIYHWKEGDYREELRLIPPDEISVDEMKVFLKALKKEGASPEVIEIWQKRVDKGKAMPL